MKVLVSSLSRDFGGVESLFLSLAQYAKDNDIQMDFVCTDSSAAREEEFASYGSRVHHVERPSRNLRRFSDSFKKLFESEKYDIYHVNLTRYRFPLDILLAKKYGAKVILHCHATQIYDVGSLKYRMIRKTEQMIFRPLTLSCSNLNLACSDNAGRYLFPKGKYQVLHNGIDLGKFRYSEEDRNRIRSELGLEGKKIIGHIGRFSHEKNHSYLLSVLKEMLKKDSEYRLLCVGSGDLFRQKTEEAEEMGIADEVVFTGQRRDTYALLSAMDIFVFPSIHEALPITLIEAQANGLPCVVSDCVTKEIDVIDRIVRLSLTEDPAIWADRAGELTGKREILMNISKFHDFDIASMAKRLRDIYANVI